MITLDESISESAQYPTPCAITRGRFKGAARCHTTTKSRNGIQHETFGDIKGGCTKIIHHKAWQAARLELHTGQHKAALLVACMFSMLKDAMLVWSTYAVIFIVEGGLRDRLGTNKA